MNALWKLALGFGFCISSPLLASESLNVIPKATAPRFEIEFTEIPVADLLRQIEKISARVAPVRVVIAPGVTGVLDKIHLKSVTTEEAIQGVAQAAGLQWTKLTEGMFFVAPPGTPLPLQVPPLVETPVEMPVAPPAAVAVTPPTGKAGTVWEGISLTLQTPNGLTNFKAGELITVDIVFRNLSGTTKSLPIFDPLLLAVMRGQAQLSLRDHNGEAVPLTRYGLAYQNRQASTATLSLTPLVLKPGEARRFSCEISRLFDMTQAGTYSLSVNYAAPLFFGARRDLPKPYSRSPMVRAFPAPRADEMPNPLRRSLERGLTKIPEMPNPLLRDENDTVALLSPDNIATAQNLAAELKIEVRN